MKIKEIVPVYLRHLKAIGRSPYTIKGNRAGLRKFMKFLEEEGIQDLDELSLDVLENYQEELAFQLTAKGNLLAIRTQGNFLGIVKGFTRFLKEKDYLLHDPGEKIILPKKPKRLPKVILSLAEVKRLMAAPDMNTNRGYRNRVILEILYDTAIRRSEASNIKLSDLDLKSGFIQVRGKGDKDRVVPLSKRVCKLVENYIIGVRPAMLLGEENDYLVLNRWGRKLDAMGIYSVVKRCAYLAKLKKNITTHTFRHACATHMLKNGAPVRHLQEMLGHESLETTQIYTHVTINDLKEVHAKYHPNDKMND